MVRFWTQAVWLALLWFCHPAVRMLSEESPECHLDSSQAGQHLTPILKCTADLLARTATMVARSPEDLSLRLTSGDKEGSYISFDPSDVGDMRFKQAELNLKVLWLLWHRDDRSFDLAALSKSAGCWMKHLQDPSPHSQIICSQKVTKGWPGSLWVAHLNNRTILV